MKTVTWGWEPPQYEIIRSVLIRIFYYSEMISKTVSRLDPETEEETSEEITSWKCNVIEVNDRSLFSMIKENPNSIECQKKLLTYRINAYDSSDHVNTFSISGLSTWLDKATRVGLKLRFEAEKRLGKTETTLWQDGIQFPLPLTGDITALDMLDGIELYASSCYDTTQYHLGQVKSLTNIDEIKAYDYTVGYPEKLVF